jgi:hypothetical protein
MKSSMSQAMQNNFIWQGETAAPCKMCPRKFQKICNCKPDGICRSLGVFGATVWVGGTFVNVSMSEHWPRMTMFHLWVKNTLTVASHQPAPRNLSVDWRRDPEDSGNLQLQEEEECSSWSPFILGLGFTIVPPAWCSVRAGMVPNRSPTVPQPFPNRSPTIMSW